MQRAVAQQVTGALSASATELTRNNSALAGMVAQLEALAGDGAVRDMHGGNSGAKCAPPCLDLRQYPALHSQACICAEQAFARMRALGERIALLSARAVVGELPFPFTADCSAINKLVVRCAPARAMGGLQKTVTAHACRRGPSAGVLHDQSGHCQSLAGAEKPEHAGR